MKRILMAMVLCLVCTLGFSQQYCPDSVMDAAGNTYSTVQVGSQCWMKEDLRWADPVKYSMRSMSGGYDEQVYLFGLKYPFTKNDICPTGWKLPTHDDWNNLPVTDSIMYRCTDEYLSLVCGKWTSYGWMATEYMVDSKPYYAMRVYSDRDSSLYDEVFVISMNNSGGSSTSYQQVSSREFNQSGYFYGLTNNGNDIKKGYQVRCIKDTSYTPEVTQPDTIYIHDTIIVTDTLWLHDTIYIHDTITVTDTIYIHDGDVGIQEWGKSIKVFPNPTTSTITLENIEGCSMVVHDMVGHEMVRIQRTRYQEVVDVWNWPAGIYLVGITKGTTKYMVKFIKQ